jgi:SAM-dependent methyltransferase
MRIDLGTSNRPPDGFDLFVDIVPCPDLPADKFLEADLRKPWPWKDSSVSHLRAFDLIEHLPDKILTMNEAHRVLKPGALFHIFVPTTEGVGAWSDPTHVSWWNRAAFDYFLEGQEELTRFARSYGITARFKVRSEKRVVRGLKFKSGNCDVVYLEIELEALKNA